MGIHLGNKNLSRKTLLQATLILIIGLVVLIIIEGVTVYDLMVEREETLIEESDHDSKLSTDSFSSIFTEVVSHASGGMSAELQKTQLHIMAVEKYGVGDIETWLSLNDTFQPVYADGGRDILYSYSPDFTKVVYFTIPPEIQTPERDWKTQARLYGYSFPEAAIGSIPMLGASTMLDDSPVPYKQLPAISNTGEVLFVGWENQWQPTVEKAEEWTIYKLVDGEVKSLTQGFMPRWISDSEFIFLKNDGLYIANSDLSAVTRLHELQQGDTVVSNERIDVSSDGKKIVWMRPRNAETSIFHVNDAGAFEKFATIPGWGFSVRFSPSGGYVAFQTLPGDAGKDEFMTNKLMLFNIQSDKAIPELELPLDEFRSLRVLLTNWTPIP
jgi:uncharacterized protein YxeA